MDEPWAMHIHKTHYNLDLGRSQKFPPYNIIFNSLQLGYIEMTFCFETPKKSQNCKVMNPITFRAHNFLIWLLIGDFSKTL
jgi:hypothetical protein